MTYNVYFFLVIARTSGGMYPALPLTPPAAQPSAPPADEGYQGSSDLSSSSSSSSRGTVRPHSLSPFLRNVRQRIQQEEDVDIEAVACLLNFATREDRGGSQTTTTTVSTFKVGGEAESADVTVQTFRTSTPRTPAAATRPDSPPRISPAESSLWTPQDQRCPRKSPARCFGRPPPHQKTTVMRQNAVNCQTSQILLPLR